MLQIQSENNFLDLPINTNKPNFVVCMVFVGAADSFATEKLSQNRMPYWFLSQTVNSQGYSELREPIKMHENCYSLIW